MSRAFEIRMAEHKYGVYWFKVKDKYDVRIDIITGKSNCTCQGDTFKQGGRKQVECKHISKAREVIETLRRKSK